MDPSSLPFAAASSVSWNLDSRSLQIVCTKTFIGIGNSKPILFTSLFMIITVGKPATLID